MQAMMVKQIRKTVVELCVIDLPVRAVVAVIIVKTPAVYHCGLTARAVLLKRVESVADWT
ncbi:hypothetical protein T458_22260 [Brevibacillus panacihumi W25]|uniref:Uncharacterized protein n=1 Tax=Brevibacillus panacihumi W25 TaxID=1408254 RepID=V6M5T2_9BACL|nr:hypothetical protein T458_22260 [Brevibacillus panacihumi W25]